MLGFEPRDHPRFLVREAKSDNRLSKPPSLVRTFPMSALLSTNDDEDDSLASGLAAFHHALRNLPATICALV